MTQSSDLQHESADSAGSRRPRWRWLIILPLASGFLVACCGLSSFAWSVQWCGAQHSLNLWDLGEYTSPIWMGATILLGAISGLCFAAGALAWRNKNLLSRVISVFVFLISGILGLFALFFAIGQYAGICY